MDEAIPPWFPAWCIQFSEPISDSRITAAMLLQNRKHERWLLLGYPAAVSERHLWATWLALRERVISEKMISNSLDGEFLRLIAGKSHSLYAELIYQCLHILSFSYFPYYTVF